jgi:hypothetical protein
VDLWQFPFFFLPMLVMKIIITYKQRLSCTSSWLFYPSRFNSFFFIVSCFLLLSSCFNNQQWREFDLLWLVEVCWLMVEIKKGINYYFFYYSGREKWDYLVLTLKEMVYINDWRAWMDRLLEVATSADWWVLFDGFGKSFCCQQWAWIITS